MPRLILSAQPCTFAVSATGFKSRSHALLSNATLGRQEHDIKKAAEVAPLVNAFRAEIEAERPGVSFFVTQSLGRGDRSPTGYKALPYVAAEIDHDTPGGVCTTPPMA